jgi:hypothetical protein
VPTKYGHRQVMVKGHLTSSLAPKLVRFAAKFYY